MDCHRFNTLSFDNIVPYVDPVPDWTVSGCCLTKRNKNSTIDGRNPQYLSLQKILYPSPEPAPAWTPVDFCSIVTKKNKKIKIRRHLSSKPPPNTLVSFLTELETKGWPSDYVQGTRELPPPAPQLAQAKALQPPQARPPPPTQHREHPRRPPVGVGAAGPNSQPLV